MQAGGVAGEHALLDRTQTCPPCVPYVTVIVVPSGAAIVWLLLPPLIELPGGVVQVYAPAPGISGIWYSTTAPGHTTFGPIGADAGATGGADTEPSSTCIV